MARSLDSCCAALRGRGIGHENGIQGRACLAAAWQQAHAGTA